jgi:hypothetical protein
VHLKAYNKAWYCANQDRLKAKQKAYYAANPDKMKAYREATRDKKKAYRAANREKIRARSKEWRESNRCEHGRVKRECGICDPRRATTVYKWSAKRRDHVWELTDEQAVWIMQQPCAYCGQGKAGGIDRAKNEYGYTVLNAVPCCSDCNYSKRTRTVKAFIVAVNATARYCPDYPKFKKRWENIRRKLTRLGEKQCLCSSTSVPSATPHKKDSRRSQNPRDPSGVRAGGSWK